MKAAAIWLLWKRIPNPDPSKKPRKVPYYASGVPRSGELDSPEDRAQLVTFEEASAAYERSGGYEGLAFALGPDGNGWHWQGIDLDDIRANGLQDIADRWVRGDCTGWAYMEASPSGQGVHIIGYGQAFQSLGSNGSGIEAYAGGRYFTFTGQQMLNESPCRLVDLADYVEQLASRHAAGRPSVVNVSRVEVIPADPKTFSELRSALAHLRPDDRDQWVAVAHALYELGETGRGLFLWWSEHCDGAGLWDPKEANRVWATLKPTRTGFQSVFKRAKDQGWINPASNAAQLVGAAPVVGDFHGRTPRNFLNTASAPPLDPAHVPAPIAHFADRYASAHGFDRSGIIMAAIASAGAMIGDDYVLEAKPGWRLSARLWMVLIGRSAAGKSPTIKAATAPIKTKHSELLAYFNATYQPDPDNPLERPPEPALYTSDTTIEALSEKLRNNPRGLLMLTEEFSSWIGSIDSSGRGEAAKNRGAWLQLYDGGPYQIDRIGRKSYQVPNWGASVLTATTPSALAEHMKHLPEDGLIQRFIPIILAPRDFDADGDARSAQDYWHQCLYYVFGASGGTVQFSPDARRLFKTTEAELGQMAASMDDISPALASHIGKHSEMVARIALVFHAFESATGELPAETLQKAINLMGQVRKHSVALYTDILGRSPATEVARALARSLAAADQSLQTVGRDWMTQHCRAFEKAGNDRVRREAVQLLEDLDWLKDVSTRSYGGWPTRWEVNRNIFRLYAREGEAHRAQRAAVQALFGETDRDAA
jgi:hypothetical protein